jgi:peptidoglycan/xylan/chitin deacetylase (PgdA/CDA1 family)
MPGRHSAPRTTAPRTVAALAVPLAAALTVSCAPGQQPRQVVDLGRVTVNGRALLFEALPTVGAALTKSDTPLPTGRLLSIVLRKRLGPDRAPGRVLLNGLATTVAAPLHAGDSVVTVPGPDAVEATRTVVETFPAMGVASLYVGGHPGTTRVVLGAVSGEVLSRKVVAAPLIGHLPAPGALALTFDDGPNPAWTPRVLALLARAHAHATFCVIGRQVAQYPDLVRAIVAGGHTLCNHTWDHDEKLPSRTPAQIRSEMTRTQEAVKAATRKTPRLFRAPAGAWSPAIEGIARSLRMTPLKWTVDPRDWARPSTRAILVRTLARLRPGGVVLLHDGGGDRSETFAALAQLLRLLPRLHYTYAVPQP